MTPRRALGRLALLHGLLLLLAACGGGSKHAGSTGVSNPLLVELNAARNDGRTYRWPALPVEVHLGDVARAGEVTTWSSATGGAVSFRFVGSPPAAGVSFQAGSLDNDTCGQTEVIIDLDRGELVAARVEVNPAIYRGPQCVRTVTHETGHAIGIGGHTRDGGLMDDDGGNGAITEPVADMLRELYALPPNTSVSLAEASKSRSGGRGHRRIVTIYRARP